MSDFETASDLGTEGGYVPETRPTAVFGSPYVAGMGRDVQTDARRMGDVDVFAIVNSDSGGNIMDDRDLDDQGWLCDARVTTLATEKRRLGWDPLATPSEGIPGPANTAGTRGADDIGKI